MTFLCRFISLIVVSNSQVYTASSSTFAESFYKEWTELLVQQLEISNDDSNAFNVVNFPKVNADSAIFLGQTNEKSHSFYSIPYGEPPTGDLRFFFILS